MCLTCNQERQKPLTQILTGLAVLWLQRSKSNDEQHSMQATLGHGGQPHTGQLMRIPTDTSMHLTDSMHGEGCLLCTESSCFAGRLPLHICSASALHAHQSSALI